MLSTSVPVFIIEGLVLIHIGSYRTFHYPRILSPGDLIFDTQAEK